MVLAKKYLYVRAFEGYPKEGDLKIVEEQLPPLKDGQFLAEALYLSVDPYMRAYAPQLELNTTFIGSQVAKVIETKNPDHPIGEIVVGKFGWQTHTIVTPELEYYVLPNLRGLPLSLALGVLGMPGNSAYFGLLEICKPKSGETVVVSGAAGAVGSIVGQIAKIKGCKVIGITGSDTKGKWLKQELRFDHFLNYKDHDFEGKLIEVTPNGVHCYFDNVGGEVSSMVLKQMNDLGRVAVCGAISTYNATEQLKVEPLQWIIVRKQLKVEGFLTKRWSDRWLEGLVQNKSWINEGKLKYKETITEGFDNMFKAFVDMLKGVNLGKAIVKV